MPYVHRYAPLKKRSVSPELMYLFFALAAGVATAWWAGRVVGMDLSGIATAPSVLGLTETGRFTHGAVGYNVNTATDQLPAAPFCNPGQMPAFARGLSGLKQQLGEAMANPVEVQPA